MAKIRLNGTARWIIVGLAVLGLAFNSGILYNHVQELSKKVDNLIETVEKLDGNIDTINIKLAERTNQ